MYSEMLKSRSFHISQKQYIIPYYIELIHDTVMFVKTGANLLQTNLERRDQSVASTN